MTSEQDRVAQVAACPTCQQHHPSLILADDALDGFMALTSMDAHPSRGHPMGYRHEAEVRDAAAKMAARITALEAEVAALKARPVPYSPYKDGKFEP